MSDDDDQRMDDLLRASLASPPPVLSPHFERALASRLRGRELSRTGRRVLGAYAVAATLVSLWGLAGLPSGVIAALLAASLLVPAATYRAVVRRPVLSRRSAAVLMGGS